MPLGRKHVFTFFGDDVELKVIRNCMKYAHEHGSPCDLNTCYMRELSKEERLKLKKPFTRYLEGARLPYADNKLRASGKLRYKTVS